MGHAPATPRRPMLMAKGGGLYPDPDYKFNATENRWVKKTQWDRDFEKAMKKLDREFPGFTCDQ